MEEYFRGTKKELERKIPEFKSKEFRKMRDKIKNQLKRKENDFNFVVRSLKIVILGDWKTDENRKKLHGLKAILLRNGIYAQTIDDYYDMDKKDGLNQTQILETCCINHQLVVFIDGEGPGTITEQNYLTDNYIFQGKVIFFINKNKFNDLKDKPNEYIRIFPTIITHTNTELQEKVLVYSRFRIYRLADIIMKQREHGKGLNNPSYQPWKKRITRIRNKQFI